jgi:hypothetical protein
MLERLRKTVLDEEPFSEPGMLVLHTAALLLGPRIKNALNVTNLPPVMLTFIAGGNAASTGSGELAGN